MTVTLESLSRDCKRILTQSNTPAGRAQVATLLGEVLRDPAFLAELFDGGVSERQVVYEDADLGFCILAHEYPHARQGGVHDHGDSWAIYGQARGESVMTEYELVDPATGDRRAVARKVRSYTMRPGDAHVYNEGAIHAVSHPGPSRLVRIEGRDLAKVKRGTYVTAEA